METKKNEQPEATETRPSDEAAGAAVEDSSAGATDGQPAGRKWANMFETPEKLEEAYRHLYRAYHERSREMKDLKELVGAPGETAGDEENVAAEQPPAEKDDGAGLVDTLMQMVAEARLEAQRAREAGERVLVSSLEGQIRGFYEGHPELETMSGGLNGFRQEVLGMLGSAGSEALVRMPDVLEKAYRVATYPAARREAEKRAAASDEASKRFAVREAARGR